jgi:hypothetical protein
LRKIAGKTFTRDDLDMLCQQTNQLIAAKAAPETKQDDGPVA